MEAVARLVCGHVDTIHVGDNYRAILHLDAWLSTGRSPTAIPMVDVAEMTGGVGLADVDD